MILDAITIYLVLGIATTQELRWAGRGIPAGRGILVMLTWPFALALEIFGPPHE